MSIYDDFYPLSSSFVKALESSMNISNKVAPTLELVNRMQHSDAVLQNSIFDFQDSDSISNLIQYLNTINNYESISIITGYINDSHSSISQILNDFKNEYPKEAQELEVSKIIEDIKEKDSQNVTVNIHVENHYQIHQEVPKTINWSLLSILVALLIHIHTVYMSNQTSEQNNTVIDSTSRTAESIEFIESFFHKINSELNFQVQTESE